MEVARPGLSEERRARLAVKGKILYGELSGIGGRGIRAESFALYQLRRDETEVAVDPPSFLEARIGTLEADDA